MEYSEHLATAGSLSCAHFCFLFSKTKAHFDQLPCKRNCVNLNLSDLVCVSYQWLQTFDY